MSGSRFIVAMACVALATGCGDPVAGIGDHESPTLTTDRSSYVAVCVDTGSGCDSYAFPVIATYANPTEDTVYLGRNNHLRPLFFVVTDHARGSAYNGWVQDREAPEGQFGVPPGGERTDTLRLMGPSVWDVGAGEYRGVMEGEFRIRYIVRACPGLCSEVLPEEATLSNTFFVTLGGGQ